MYIYTSRSNTFLVTKARYVILEIVLHCISEAVSMEVEQAHFDEFFEVCYKCTVTLLCV